MIENHQAKEAFDFYQQMNVPSDEYLTSILFKICAHLGDVRSLEYGKRVFDNLPIRFKGNIILFNSALRMFIKCGDMLSAEQLFVRMKKDHFSYSVMMAGKGIH